LLNSGLATAAAEGLAQRVITLAGPDPIGQIHTLFDLALQREPSLEEQADCREFLRQHPLTDLCRAIQNLNEFAYVD
jgi:hypothetical protein